MGLIEGNAKDIFSGLSADSISDISIADRMELLQQTRSYAYHAKAASYLVSPILPSGSSSTAFEPNLIRRSTSYIITRSGHLENNVDHWMTDTEDEALRLRRDATVLLQQASLAQNNGVLSSFWYMLAFLPLCNFQRQGWCSPRNSFLVILNSVDIFTAWLKQMISNLRTQLSEVDIDQLLHDCFVVGMDIILTLQTFAFLMLSFYQASL
ncbi:uncharacterized protein LOC125234838 [Leguminivora glycinivorella]|uniref:uncharacterized protein LOC125234838 n=1 Tax=Leguminivora glycinivorella TaxID=1035111 RepID=UPI00200D85FA|nr:uncharacterized protein LOC125234838 [Leguminivora glycinivorella]